MAAALPPLRSAAIFVERPRAQLTPRWHLRNGRNSYY